MTNVQGRNLICLCSSLSSRYPLEPTSGYVERGRHRDFFFSPSFSLYNKPIYQTSRRCYQVSVSHSPSSLYHYSYTYMLPFLSFLLSSPIRPKFLIKHLRPPPRYPIPCVYPPPLFQLFSFRFSQPFLAHIATIPSNLIKKSRRRNRTPGSRSILSTFQSAQLYASHPITRSNYFASSLYCQTFEFHALAYSSLFFLLPSSVSTPPLC